MLTFDESSHEYRMHGKVVPSVTQILGVLSDFSGVPEHILESARDRGTATHIACHLDDRGILDKESLSDEIIPRLSAWRKFKMDYPFEVIQSETPVYHPIYGYAGTPDRGIILADTLDEVVVDIKTGPISSPIGMQIAAYKDAMVNNNVISRDAQRWSVHLGADGKYKIKKWEDASDFTDFLAVLRTMRIIEKFK